MFIKDEIEKNEINFKVDHNINWVLNGMCFSTNESEEKSIIYGKKYLDTYSIKSSFHYSILIHEFKHIYDYSNNKNTFLNSRKNHFKIHEFNALKMKAEFIKYYLNKEYKLSKMENCILQSYEKDNLESASVLLQEQSIEIFSYFNELQNEYIEKIHSKEEIIKNIENIGILLIKNYNSAIGEIDQYFHSVRLYSFLKNINDLIYIICDKSKVIFNEFKNKNIEIEKIFKSIDKILCEDHEKNTQYMYLLYNDWENDIIYGKYI